MLRLKIPKTKNPAEHTEPLLEGQQGVSGLSINASVNTPINTSDITSATKPGFWVGRFQAMASDCEVLMEGVVQQQAAAILKAIAIETWRIEHKFSRYVDDNVMSEINTSKGERIVLDEETSALLDFSDQCFQLSDGMFDVTSGVLRRIWRFDGSSTSPSTIPDAEQIAQIVSLIGWQKLCWQRPHFSMPENMELDFGGIGKEYAVDRAMAEINLITSSNERSSFVVNFGGDLACTGPRLNGKPWMIGVDSIQRDSSVAATLSLTQGAVATSGDSRRYVIRDGKRLGHILNPLTGQPVEGAPNAVSVAAQTCLQAGMLSTLAMLQGTGAEAFLKAQGVQYWVQENPQLKNNSYTLLN